MGGGRVIEAIGKGLGFVRFSHTLFAMPFALAAMVVAAGGAPEGRVFLLIVLAMVSARTAAMTFNRLADWTIDQRNPRTEGRHRLMSHRAACVLLLVSTLVFLAVAAAINSLCLWLSPVALGIVFFYSLTKRFTSLSHFFLGLALSVSPVGAWLAVSGQFDFAPLVLALAVLLWVAGFDVIYATQDHEFDRRSGLHSMVVQLGVPRSLTLAQALHWAMWVGLAGFGYFAGLGAVYFGGLVPIAGALVYEHRSAARLDLEGVNRAFFASNVFVGAVFLAAVCLDAWLRL